MKHTSYKIFVLLCYLIFIIFLSENLCAESKSLGEGAEESMNKICKMSEGDIRYFQTKGSTTILIKSHFWNTMPSKSKVHLIMIGMLYTIERNRKQGTKIDQLFIQDMNTKKVLLRGAIPEGKGLGDIEIFK